MKVPGGELVEGRPKHTITIGQLAAYAGVTVKAVRHYHQRGLLEEPPRDSSGYRRYSAQQAIDLVKIKTLAEAGVPLARIKELLAAGPDRFAAAIAEIDHRLQERAEELLRTRERIARLRSGDRLFVSSEVADFLDQLQELGVSQRAVQMERDGWILMQSASPKEAALWIADKRDAICDPEFRSIYVECDSAFDLPPDDPRLPVLADRIRRWLANWLRDSRAKSGRSRTQPSPGWSRARSVRCRRPGACSPKWLRSACRMCEGPRATARGSLRAIRYAAVLLRTGRGGGSTLDRRARPLPGVLVRNPSPAAKLAPLPAAGGVHPCSAA